MMTGITAWTADFAAVMAQIGPRFARSEARQHAADHLRGLLSHTARKNGWQLAETVGDATPYGIQQFLYRAAWDPDAVRDDLRDYVVAHLGDPQGILVVDETGFLKKGDKSAGVQPQYSGAAGRTANAQIGVFLTYAGPRGHTFLDRALYLPAGWTDDRERCRAAGIPDEVAFATKPAQAQAMLERALDAGVPAAWVTADSIYGDVKYLRVWLEARPIGYVLAVSGKDTVWEAGWRQRRISTLLAAPPTEGWARLSAGDGAKGPRFYDWLRLPLAAPLVAGWRRWVLLRRSVADPTEITAYVCFCPAETTFAELVRVAGARWTVEICFEAAKQEVGLDEYEVRSWTGWHRHITLACLAHAFLTVVRAHGVDPLAETKKGDRPSGSLARFRASRRASSP
jgi:SRSO17 transposase